MCVAKFRVRIRDTFGGLTRSGYFLFSHNSIAAGILAKIYYFDGRDLAEGKLRI
jgi:hypothetical protein